MSFKARLDRGRIIVNSQPHVFATWNTLSFWLDLLKAHPSDAMREPLQRRLATTWRKVLQHHVPRNELAERQATVAGQLWQMMGLGVLEITLETKHRARIRWGHAQLSVRDPMILLCESYLLAWLWGMQIPHDDIELRLLEEHPSICFWEATWTHGN